MQKQSPDPVRNLQIRGKTVQCGRNDACPCGSGKKFKNCHNLFKGKTIQVNIDTSRGQFFGPTGEPTTQDDPDRLIWYSATCYFWTDDWSVLKVSGGRIPVCPTCGSPGMQSKFCGFDKNNPNRPEKAKCVPFQVPPSS